MNRKIVFHIGASKTGSSAIQSFIAVNKDYFKENGFVIPDKFLKLGENITGEHVFSLQKLILNDNKAQLRDAFDILDNTAPKEKAILFSAENLSNIGKHQIFKNNLEGFDVKVILYIRRQDDLLCSAWQQWHSKIERDIHAWLIRALMHYGHWDRVIQNWESVVGEGNVSVRLFQRDDMVEGDLFRDFLAALDLDPKTNEPNFDIGTINPSYNDIITPLITNNPGIFSDVHDNSFYSFIDKFTGDTYTKTRKVSLITREQRNSIIQYYANANQRVCKKYFPGRQELFAKVRHADYDYLAQEEMTERQMKFLTALIYRVGQKQS